MDAKNNPSQSADRQPLWVPPRLVPIGLSHNNNPSSFVLPRSGVRALRERGGDRHHQTGQEDSHHHLQAGQAAGVSGKTH